MKKYFLTNALGWALVVHAVCAQPVSTNQSKTIHMKEFSFLVRVPLTYSREQVAAANVKWNSLLEQWKKEEIYIISFPFPGEGYVVSGNERAIKKESVVSDNRRVVSHIFLRAKDFESALALAKTFPILEFDGSVEVREILPRPGSAN